MKFVNDIIANSYTYRIYKLIKLCSRVRERIYSDNIFHKRDNTGILITILTNFKQGFTKTTLEYGINKGFFLLQTETIQLVKETTVYLRKIDTYKRSSTALLSITGLMLKDPVII
jgi:hypothetical protein